MNADGIALRNCPSASALSAEYAIHASKEPKASSFLSFGSTLGDGELQWRKAISSDGHLVGRGEIIYGPDLPRIDNVIGNAPVLRVGVERHTQVNLDADLDGIL